MKKKLLIGIAFVLATCISFGVVIFNQFNFVISRSTDFKDSTVFYDEQFVVEDNTRYRVVSVDDKNSDNFALVLLKKTVLGWKCEKTSFKSSNTQTCSLGFTTFRGRSNDSIESHMFVIIQSPYIERLPKLELPTSFYANTFLYSDENKQQSMITIHGQSLHTMNGYSYYDSFGNDDIEDWYNKQ